MPHAWFAALVILYGVHEDGGPVAPIATFKSNFAESSCRDHVSDFERKNPDAKLKLYCLEIDEDEATPIEYWKSK